MLTLEDFLKQQGTFIGTEIPRLIMNMSVTDLERCNQLNADGHPLIEQCSFKDFLISAIVWPSPLGEPWHVQVSFVHREKIGGVFTSTYYGDLPSKGEWTTQLVTVHGTHRNVRFVRDEGPFRD